jgi:putative DNA primase/helicase
MRDGRAIAERLGGHRYRRGWMFRCPCHADRNPSCSVRDDGLVTCFAGCDRFAVEAALDRLGFPDDGRRAEPRDPTADRRRGTEEAQSIFEDALCNPSSMEGVSYYLQSRGITWTPNPDVMRRWGHNGYIVAVQQLDGEVTAVQTKLLPGHRGITRGWLGAGAVQLAPPKVCDLSDAKVLTIGLAEGVETALSAMQLTNIPCWAVLGARRLPTVAVPAAVRRVVIFADNDDPGREQAKLAAAVHAGAGRLVRRWWPNKVNDWNDLLKQRKKTS